MDATSYLYQSLPPIREIDHPPANNNIESKFNQLCSRQPRPAMVRKFYKDWFKEITDKEKKERRDNLFN